jgi:hypothetical protein
MRRHTEDIIWGVIFIFIIICTIGYALWIRGNNNKVKVIDGCQYIQNYNGHGGWNLTHKGNCTNFIHYKK